MKFNSKGLFSKAFGLLALGNLLVYALLHISFNISSDISVSPDFAFYFEMVRGYITDAWELAFPIVAALLMLSELKYNGAKKAFLGGFIMSLSRLFYSLFYYYIVFITAGYDTSESIPYALLASIGAILLCFISLTVLTGIGYVIFKRSGEEKPPLSAIPSVAVAITAVQFIIFIAVELVDTVEFFTDYGLDYTFEEIALIAFNYLYILVMTVVAYYLGRAILTQVEKKRLGA